MKKFLVIAVSSVLLIIGVTNIHAEEKILNKEEAMALFKDKTFDGYQETKKKNFKVYSSQDGDHEVHFEGGKNISRFWRINEKGEHCVSKKKGKGGRCSTVKSLGNGVYHKITNDEHTHTLRNFKDGNQL